MNDDDQLRLAAADLAEDLERIAAQPHPLTSEQRATLRAVLQAARQTFTVVGVWRMGDTPVPVAVIRGEHPVEGGRWDAFPEGLWATSVDATDAAHAERAAVEEMDDDDDAAAAAYRGPDKCPVCGAAGGDPCESSNGRIRSDHARRVRRTDDGQA